MADTNFELLVTPEELRVKSSEIATSLSSMKTLLDDVFFLASGSSAYWLSEGGDYVRSKIVEVETAKENALSRLNKQPLDLESIAGLYEITELENNAKAMELSGDILL